MYRKIAGISWKRWPIRMLVYQNQMHFVHWRIGHVNALQHEASFRAIALPTTIECNCNHYLPPLIIEAAKISVWRPNIHRIYAIVCVAWACSHRFFGWRFATVNMRAFNIKWIEMKWDQWHFDAWIHITQSIFNVYALEMELLPTPIEMHAHLICFEYVYLENAYRKTHAVKNDYVHTRLFALKKEPEQKKGRDEKRNTKHQFDALLIRQALWLRLLLQLM